jgi:hypothetical protein
VVVVLSLDVPHPRHSITERPACGYSEDGPVEQWR